MRVIRLSHQMPAAEAEQLRGKWLGDDSFDILVGDEPTTVLRPDGELLLRYLPQAIDPALCEAAWSALRKVGGAVSNRGVASGVRKTRNIVEGGVRSNTLRIKLSRHKELRGIGSGIIGAFERNVRHPVCRLTAFNLTQPDKFAQAVPFFQAIDRVFCEQLPARWAAQMFQQERTHPAWRIHSTSFTTVTVNKDFRTAVHRDVGDLAEGFGVLTALRAGHFDGCYLVFPAFRVAVDLRTRGVLLCDVHQWHGNTELRGIPGQFERISCVLYYRRRMHACGSPEEELERAKRRQPGDPIWSPGTFAEGDEADERTIE